MPDSPQSNSGQGNSTASAAGVAGGAWGMAGTIISAVAQKYATKKNMEYQSEWAYRQREWALQDRDYNNWYNSPAEQRKRMIAAGMNPALMYGNGSGVVQATQPRSTPSPQVQIQAPDLSGIGRAGLQGLSMYYDVKMQEQQLRNMQMQNEMIASNIEKNRVLNALNWNKAELTETQNARLTQIVEGVKQLNALGAGGEYSPGGDVLTVDASKMLNDNRYKSALALVTANENNRREIYTAANAEQIAERILTMQKDRAKTDAEINKINQDIELLKKSGILKQFQITGEEFLNQKFSGTASKILLLLINKMLD